MSKIQLSKDFSIPAIDYAGQGNAILGIRDAGKTYTAMKVAEELMDNGIPVIVYDPVGVWKNLKIGSGNKKGYPIVTAGGEESDIRLTIHNAVDIVRAAMKENISLVIDLYSPELINKSTWIRVVQETVDLLMYENKSYGMRHIFIEEAAEFIPQRLQPQHSKVYASIERLARMGRNARLGYTIINQRAEEINKAILEISSMSLLHKQVGKNSLLSITKWLDVLQVENKSDIVKSLPGLKQGECWVVGTGVDPFLIQVATKKTFHPDPKKITEQAEISKKKTDVSAFVEKLNKLLVKPEKEVIIKKEVSSGSAKQIAELKNQLEEKESELEGWRKTAMARGILLTKIKNFVIDIDFGEIEDHKSQVKIAARSAGSTAGFIVAATQKPAIKYKSPAIIKSNASWSSLPTGELKILTAAAQYPNGLTRGQLTGIAGFKRSSRDAYIARLKQKNFVDQEGDRIVATQDGINFLGDNYDPLPTGKALQEYWQNNLPVSEWKILELSLSVFPQTISRDQITESTNLLRSSRDAYIARLKQKELITTPAAGEVRAADILFQTS